MEPNVADVLIEALPYMRRFYKNTVVIKYGGHAMKDEQLKDAFAQDISLLQVVGVNPVVVHGGGPQINQVLEQMGIVSRFVRGMRVTDAPTMDVVEMVLGGKVNKSIVSLISRAGGRAVGLSGKDGGLLTARKMTLSVQEDALAPPEIIDPGQVGTVTKVDPAIIHTLGSQGFVPVIAPVGVGEDGQTFNINADLVAGKVASSLKAARLILITDVDGVLDNDSKLISSLNAASARRMIKSGIIAGGMIPKVECALDALSHGVEKVHIINGKKRHAILLELFTDKGIGTEVTLN
jgi:acetylglutamate kinase